MTQHLGRLDRLPWDITELFPGNSLELTDLENANADRLFKVLNNI